ncbi:hypothetical protein NP233_g13066 [Leucocoprinus birnbaumii]|uniref:Uncharacterized protein n=1 Tax=Leucocoprinus birnbaumii TaxID=56174 RepID=A0AAD5VIY5_9AGAR|nr:hypothetical protein NP233_g13066 [Leucocoprinus birnbaumii]
MPISHPASRPRIADARPPKIAIDLPHVDYSPLVFWRIFESTDIHSPFFYITPTFFSRALGFDAALHEGNPQNFRAIVGYNQFAVLFNQQSIDYKMHVLNKEGTSYFFPTGGFRITTSDIDLSEYDRAYPISDPLLISLGIINENGTLNYPNLLMIARKVLHAPSPPSSHPRYFNRAGPSTRPYHHPSRKHTLLGSGNRGRPRFPRVQYLNSKLPCHHPLSQATTIDDTSSLTTPSLEVSSISYQSTSASSSTPPTPNSSPSDLITEDKVLSMLEDPLHGLTKSLFNIPEETINPIDISTLPRIDDPVVEPSISTTQELSAVDQSDPIRGVASLSLNDEEDTEGSVVDFNMVSEEEASA